jgi:chromosome segregation ATPase
VSAITAMPRGHERDRPRAATCEKPRTAPPSESHRLLELALRLLAHLAHSQSFAARNRRKAPLLSLGFASGHTRCTRLRGPPRVKIFTTARNPTRIEASALFTWSEPMVTFLKGRRRNDDTLVAVDESGRNIAAKLEALVARAEAAAEQLRALAPVMDRSAELETLRERCVAVERQVEGLGALGDRLGAAERQAERLESAGQQIDGIQARMGDLGQKVDSALHLRDDVERVLSLEGPVQVLRNEAEALRAQIVDMSEGVSRIRAQHDDALTAHRHTMSRLEAIDQEHQASAGRLEETERRLQGVERSLDPLTQATDAIPSVQHQLAVLKSLAEHLAQKTTSLEQQREAVDRAAGQISKLTVMDRELDTWLRRQEEQIRRFGAIETKIADVQAQHVKVMGRSDELQAAQQEAESAQQAARQALTDLREQMRKSSEGFELENRGLHAVSERVADLRGAVKECEARFAVLDAASQGASAVQTQVRSVGEQASVLAQELARMSEEARRIATLREDAERLEAIAGDTGERMQRIEALKPQLEEAVRQLATLKGAHEMMADGLEQMRMAQDEMARVREGHAETQQWLTTTDGWTRKVEAQVKELRGMEPAVERIRGEVEHVRTAMADIESRSAVVDEVHRRLGDLGAVSAELKERAEALRTRMDGAEARFGQLAGQADEANRVSDSIAAVTASVTSAERRLDGVDGSVRALESRTTLLDELEERIRLLGQELEQRQGALDKATEHLTRASALRQESAEAAQRLEELSRGIGTMLQKADAQAGGLDKLSRELESRADALRPIDRQLAQFESLLGQWESAQTEAARGLEQTLARQGAVDALEAQVKHVFDLSERAVEHAQTIGSSRREIEEAHELLQDTNAQLKAAEGSLQGFEARRRQLERTEQRLARAEALAMEVRSTVESLQAQRAVVEHVIERSGALTFQIKQAEALVEAMRRERTLACEVSAAVAAVREEDEEDSK